MRYEDISNVDSENGIIATLIQHPEYSFYSEFLLPSHFTMKDNQSVYLAICKLSQKGIKRVDPYNIMEVLNSDEATRRYADNLDVDKLYELIDICGSLARDTVEEYKLMVENVRNAAFRRDMLTQLKECQQLCANMDIKGIEQKIYSVLDGVMLDYSTNADVSTYGDIVEDIWEQIEARQRGETDSISFPFEALNEYVVMEPGEVVCFGAPQKAGKSAMLLTCTVDMLMKDKAVLYLDSELSTKLFTLRIIAHLTGIKFIRLRSGNYTNAEAEMVRDAIEWLKTRRFIHMYCPMLDSNTMYILAKKAKHLIDIDCIVVDYLKADSSKEEAFGVYASLGALSDTLKNKIAGEMGICGLTAAQATSSGKLADSARIARSLSTVVMIQDKTLEEISELPEGGTKKLFVQFNRNGAQMSDGEWIDMDFEGSLCRYSQAKIQHVPIEPF